MVSTIANNGKRMKPRLVKQIINSQTGEITDIEPECTGTAISEKKAELKAIELQVENEIIKKQNLELQNESLYKDIQIKNLDDGIGENCIELLKTLCKESI